MISKFNLSHSHQIGLSIILIAIASLFMMTLAVNHSEAEDSLQYIFAVTKEPSGLSLYHPNHILFNSFNYVVYQFWLFFGYQGDAGLPMQINNIIASLVVLFIVYLIAKRLEISVHLSLLCLGALSVSYGFWWYSVESETYILPLFFILLSAHRLMLLVDSHFEARHFFLLGLLTAMATLFHQQHVLLILLVPLAIFLIWRRIRSSISIGRLLRGMTVFFGVAGAIIATVYFAVAIFICHHCELAEIIKWSMGLAKDGLWTPWSSSSPIKSIVGFLRTVWGTLFLFGLPWFDALTAKVFPFSTLLEERLIGQSLSTGVIWLCLIMAVISSLCAVILSVLAVIGYRRSTPKLISVQPMKTGFLVFSVPMILVYTIFNTLWEPLNIEFWIALLPFIYLLLLLFISRSRLTQFATLISSIFVVALFIGNLLGSVLPQTDREADYCYLSNQYLMRHAERNDVVITGCPYTCTNYLHLYTDATVINVTHKSQRINYCTERDWEWLNDWINRISFHDSGRVLVSSTVFKPSLFIGMTDENKRFYQQAMEEFQPLRKYLKKVYTDKFQVVWELQLPKAEKSH